MLCSHCLKEFHFQASWQQGFSEHMQGAGRPLGINREVFRGCYCPACLRHIVAHFRTTRRSIGAADHSEDEFVGIVYPRKQARKPVPPEVPEPFAKDYDEARLVLEDSPKASAALSRRLLQRILREHFQIKERDLSTRSRRSCAGKPPMP
jgi:Domain of unknown function (DUF4145)